VIFNELNYILQWGFQKEPVNRYLTILLITLVLLSSCVSTIGFHNVIAQSTASQITIAKESSMLLLNNVKRYLPNTSIVVGVITPNGTRVYSYGNISEANSTKVNGDTIFDTASITKIFTTTLLDDMVKQGLVNLDDPIERYLPTNVKIPTYNGHKITLEDLATHTSGLPDFPAGWIRNHTYTTQQVYNFLSNTPLQSEPRTKVNYSDFGMGLLGHILSVRAGVPYVQLVKDRILNVLGMDSTGIAMNSTTITISDALKSRLAKGHIGGKEVNLEFIPEAIQGAGALHSTANDLLKYLGANMDFIHTSINDIIQETHLIRHAYPEAPSLHFDSINNKSLSASYVGLGWFIDSNLGTEVIQHSGGIDGYSTFIGFNPTKQEGVVLLCSCETKDMPSPIIESLIKLKVDTLF
jgi:serine-type D-Ala-D-Ala carboxypeptidase/endopeptidase